MSDKKPNDMQRIVIAIAAVAELFGMTLTDAALDLYVAAVAGIGVEKIERAARNAVVRCKRMPAPAELCELAGESSHEARALQAWPCVEQAIGMHGTYHHPNFDDQIINAAIRSMGGWVALCSRPTADFDKWARMEFLKAYESYSRQGVSGDICRPLTGLSDSVEVVEVKTGLPWAVEHQLRIERIDDGDDDMPRLELRRA